MREPELQYRQPYPGLINLGNICYLSSVVQCLLHSGLARAHLLSLANADAKACLFQRRVAVFVCDYGE
eukprot:2185938-Karenia_brevis.AAC.1